jgi:hypothetical protein
VQREMVPKCKLLKSISLHVQNLNYRKNVYELNDHVGEEALSLSLLLKLKLAKRTPPTSFHNCLL